MKYLSLAIIFVFILLPDLASAAGFVQCDGVNINGLKGCSLCDLVAMGNAILKWLIGVMMVIFAVILVVAGLGLVTSGGNPAAKTAAKEKITNAIIGLVIVLAAWLLVNTIMKALLVGGNGQINGVLWSTVQCQTQTVSVQNAGTSEIPQAGATPANPSITAACSDDAALIAKYKGSPVGAVAPGLQAMISCYLSDPAINSATDKNQLYTVDRSYPRCSLTNGNQVCGKCSHSNNSMHYGRGSGLGARAVDFNAVGGSLSAETALFNKLKAKQSVCKGTVAFEDNHTHISLY